MNEVNDVWRNYYEATIAFIDRGTFIDAPTKAAAVAGASQEHSDHVDWIGGVEVTQTHLELANNPTDNALKQAQLLLGIGNNIEALEIDLRERLDNVEFSWNDADTPKILEEVLETARGPVSDLYNKQRILKPTQIQAITRAKWEFINSMQRQINCLRLKIASQPPA